MKRERKLTLSQIEAMRPGARSAVSTCMGIKSSDRVFVLTDRVTHAIGRLLTEESADAGADAVIYDLEHFGRRPLTEFGEDLRRELLNYRPTVTFYAATSQPGELPFRMALRVFLLQELRVRHAHMPGITPQLMVEGMRADYKVVAALTRAVYDLGRDARIIKVSTPDGTDLVARIDPNLKWVPSTGIYHEQGQWGNLPEGETFTCPESLDGVLVAHILGDYFSEKYGVLEKPAIFRLAHGLVTAVESENAAVAAELTDYLDSSENGRRDIARNLFKGFEQYMNSYAGNGKSAVSDNTVPSPKSFRVQIMASAEKIPPSAPVLKSYPQAGYILCEGQRFMYKYTLGNFETREDAQKYCNELRDGPFPDAFVIAVKDGQLVPF